MRTTRLIPLWIAFALALATLVNPQSTVSEYQIKSAYLYNFAKMTRWPADALAENAILVIGVYGGDDGFVNALNTTLAGKSINGHAIGIRRLHAPGELKSCHMVFIRVPGNDVEALISSLGSGSVLLVGEDKDFLSAGGMINFPVRDQRVNFEVSSVSIERANLHRSL